MVEFLLEGRFFMNYDVIIVGAGPAGLFCAYELINNNKDLKVAIIEKDFLLKREFVQ